MSQSWASEQGLNKKTKYNNPTRFFWGFWDGWIGTVAAADTGQSFFAPEVYGTENRLQYPRHSPSKASRSSQKMKKQKSGGTGFSHKNSKKDFLGVIGQFRWKDVIPV